MAQFFTAARLRHPKVPWETLSGAQARHLQHEYCGEELFGRRAAGPRPFVPNRRTRPRRSDWRRPDPREERLRRREPFQRDERGPGRTETSGKRWRPTAARYPWIPAARIETPRPFAPPCRPLRADPPRVARRGSVIHASDRTWQPSLPCRPGPARFPARTRRRRRSSRWRSSRGFWPRTRVLRVMNRRHAPCRIHKGWYQERIALREEHHALPGDHEKTRRDLQ